MYTNYLPAYSKYILNENYLLLVTSQWAGKKCKSGSKRFGKKNINLSIVITYNSLLQVISFSSLIYYHTFFID